MKLYKTITINDVEFRMYKIQIKGLKLEGFRRFRFVYRVDSYLIWHDMTISDDFLKVINNENDPDRDTLIPFIYERCMAIGKKIIEREHNEH